MIHFPSYSLTDRSRCIESTPANLPSSEIRKDQEVRTAIASRVIYFSGSKESSTRSFTGSLPIETLTPQGKASHPILPDLEAILEQAPSFQGYRIGKGTNYYYSGIVLTDLTIRPANLFYRALLGADATTLPGSGKLFSFTAPHDQIKNQIAKSDPNKIVSFSASGIPALAKKRFIPDLAEIHGRAVYRISYRELQSTLASQKIYISTLLPRTFYMALQEAFLKDGIVVLPTDTSDGSPLKLRHLKTPHCAEVIQNAFRFGFTSKEHCEDILDLTLYQIGSLVVKTEDFRIFIDGDGKLIERNPGENDAIRLINACGIRSLSSTPYTNIDNWTILCSTFDTVLTGAQEGIVIFPAVGMGVWGGDPDLYWRAFLEAVARSKTPIEKILVNPAHQMTRLGRYTGCGGEEFKEILEETKIRFSDKPWALANLSKIINLFDRKTDVVQLAHLLKKWYPDKTISLLNASDPDVTLGYHVGEYVNHLGHTTTTEENYTALGTNGLGFKTITGVHEDPSRVIGVN